MHRFKSINLMAFRRLVSGLPATATAIAAATAAAGLGFFNQRFNKFTVGDRIYGNYPDG
jgi:hypothetical protein